MDYIKMESYPIGEQDFKQLREAGCIYVDKTMYIHRLLDTRSKYFFLARPHRFGKSLFLSTLRYFFEGERELFKDLDIYSFRYDNRNTSNQKQVFSNQKGNILNNNDWISYPVLYLDLNCERYADPDSLDNLLDNTFISWEKKYNLTGQSQAKGGFDKIEMKAKPHSQRFRNILREIHEKTEKEVVVLVDEYDKPLIDNLNNENNFKRFSETLASVFSVFKSGAEDLRFVFVAGVNQISKFRILSDVNNLRDLSLSNEFADICGFTEEELGRTFQSGISKLAQKTGASTEEACKQLKLNYGNYQFTSEGSALLRPWSVLNSLADSQIGNYGVYTEILSYIVRWAEGIDVDLANALHTRCSIDLLSGIDIKYDDPLTLLFRNGFLTIKKYQSDFHSVVLGVPNKEVRRGLFYLLLPKYVKVDHGTPGIIVRDIINSIELGEPEKLLKSLNIFLYGASQKQGENYKTNFHNALYILLKLIGMRSKTEFHISDDRIDMIIKSQNFIYVIELKFDTDNETNLNPTDEKNFILPFSSGNLPVFNISATYSSDTHRLQKPEIKVLFNNL